MSDQQYQITGSYRATYPNGNSKQGRCDNQTATAEFPQYAMQIVAEAIMVQYEFVDFVWTAVVATQIEQVDPMP